MASHPEVIKVLGAYVHDLKEGTNINNLHLAGQSLRNYLNSAVTVIENIQGDLISIQDPKTTS